jgi:hypothetical protein
VELRVDEALQQRIGHGAREEVLDDGVGGPALLLCVGGEVAQERVGLGR